MKYKILTVTVAALVLGGVEVRAVNNPEGCNGNKKGLLERLDTDGDGQISDAERAAAGKEQGERYGWMKKALEEFDADGDGQLSESERAEARTAREARRAEHKAKVLEKFDTDGDGQLSEEERAAAKQAREQHRCNRRMKQKMLERFDADGDGRLSESERAHARNAARKRARAKGNNGVGNGQDPAPPGDPRINDGPGTGPANPGNRRGRGRKMED